jgi:hypothetical protein
MQGGIIRTFLVLLALAATPLRAAGPFADWTAVVIAGDWRAAGGVPTNAFEFTRRDVSAALVRAGFDPANIVQFSPDPYEPGVLETSEASLTRAIMAKAATARGGCLFYVSTHGLPEGIVFGHQDMLNPGELDVLLDIACGMRPTIAVISACFSGVFVPALAASNRLVITAARPDRTSFGCGVDNRYPFFDECILGAIPTAKDFAALGTAATACVAAREKKERLSPASEPQMSVGSEMQALLPRLALRAK